MTTKGNQTVRGGTVENQKERMLVRLRELGPAGATKTELDVKGQKGKAAQALKELLSDRHVANIGTPARPCYVLSEHFNPLERACEQIERNAGSKKPVRDDLLDLLTKKELEKGCAGEARKKIDEAIDWLVKEKRLVKLRRGRSVYFVPAERLRGFVTLPPTELRDPAEPQSRPSPGPAAEEIDRRRVVAAYQRLRSRLGYSNVEISELQRELNIPMGELKRFLMEESSQGYAVLGLGDWSVSTEEIRSGAIELFGKPHLLVRFDAE
jgi:hypothetical protein